MHHPTSCTTRGRRRGGIGIVALAASAIALGVPACGQKSKPDTTDGGTPTSTEVEAEWNRSGTLSYRYEGARPVAGPKTQETLEITFQGGDDAVLTSAGGSAEVRFATDGTVVVKAVPDPDPRPVVPPYVHMFRVGAGAGKALDVGAKAVLRIPADADIPATQLTVQSEITMTLQAVTDDVARYDYETRYRLVNNAALDAFEKDVAASGPEPSVIVDKIIADAQSFRLASFGVVDFDLAKGRMVEASFTGAGLPLDSLDRDALAKSPEAIHYTLSLQGS